MVGRLTPLAAAAAIGTLIVTAGAAATGELHPAIYSIRPDGKGRALVLRLDPSVSSLVRSPGGRKIAFVRDGGFFVADVDGGHPVPIEAPSGEATFSPDGTHLAVSSYSECGWRCLHTMLYVVNTDGTGLRLVADDGRRASWSPDSKRLAYMVRGEVHVATVDGSADVSLGAGMNPVWAPRGERIAYLDAVHGYAAPCFVDADGTHRTCLRGFSAINGIVWSQDGRWLAFMQATPRRLGVVRSDGKRLTRLPVMSRPARPLAWSPDGSRIAYSKGIGEKQIYTRPVSRKSPQRRVTNEFDQSVYYDVRWRRGRISYEIYEP